MIEGLDSTSVFDSTPPPVGGLNLITALAAQRPTDALIAENVICYPDRVEMRLGATSWSTGYAKTVKGLWPYEGYSSSSLWATTDDGIFNATSSGAVGATVMALTNGYTTSATLATGANVYLNIVNGTDSLKQYDGTTWSSIATFGGLTSSNICGLEVYKQRLFFLEKNTLNLWYLAVNSVSGAATSYALGAIFRRGGAVKGIGTWTLDGGAGPDDNLAICTTNGEVAIFTGTDPSSSSTWALRGVYYIGRPVGTNCLFKFGGDLLYLSENGAYPLSAALLSASIEKSIAITNKIQQLFADSVDTYGSTNGWQALSLPDVPVLLINIPGTAGGTQFVMHSQSGAWSTFSGWAAFSLARMGSQLYFGTANAVCKGLIGTADFGANITATCMSAYTRLRHPMNKMVRSVRPIFRSSGSFSYTLGLANDFNLVPLTTTVPGGSSSSLWGSGLWGTAIWTSSDLLTRDWRTVPDIPGVYKALYFQVASTTTQVALLATDYLYVRQGKF